MTKCDVSIDLRRVYDADGRVVRTHQALVIDGPQLNGRLVLSNENFRALADEIKAHLKAVSRDR